MESINGDAKATSQVVEKKKRKTLGELLGTNGLLIAGIVGNFLKSGIFWDYWYGSWRPRGNLRVRRACLLDYKKQETN